MQWQASLIAGAGLAALVIGSQMTTPAPGQTRAVVAFEVVGDAVPLSLTGTAGDAERGRVIAFDQARGNCTICHTAPPEDRLQGNFAPPLKGTARRWSEGQLRLRVADAARLNASTLMPSYHRIEGLARVATPFRDRPVLTAQEVEDVIAYLLTLKD